jgi:hypothetical protein
MGIGSGFFEDLKKAKNLWFRVFQNPKKHGGFHEITGKEI